MKPAFFYFLLLILLAGCESVGRTIGTSTSEESSSRKVIPPTVKVEKVQEPIFVEPAEVPLPSRSVIRPQELEQDSAEVFPGAQLQIAASKKPIQPKIIQDIYFAFDEFVISPSAKLTLEVNAELFLTRHKNRNLLVEGHCDERGSMEYNLVLGARRAQVVKAYLVDLGIQKSRIRIVSYGKERPVCSQALERCW